MGTHRNIHFWIMAFFPIILSLGNCLLSQPLAQTSEINDHSFLPAGPVDQIIRHSYYSLGYSKEYKQARWVVYELSKNDVLKGVLKRSNNFRPDSKVHGLQAELSDYSGSGYDRGHLAPAADMAFNSVAMNESFLLTNSTPQKPSFNRGIWKRLEELMRSWAIQYNGIYIITGGIESNGEIGQGVDIPENIYKVVYSPVQKEMIAWVIPNKKSSEPLQNFAVNVDKVEQLSGLDFFVELEDNIENLLEKSRNIEKWNWQKISYQKQRQAEESQPLPTTTPPATGTLVKKSRSGICHGSSSPYYARTKHYTPYNSLEECLQSGGRLPKR